MGLQTKQALVNLFANKLRTCLALLGIAIGVASVIVLVSVTDLASQKMFRDLQKMGTHIVSVSMNPLSYKKDSGVNSFQPSMGPYLLQRMPQLTSLIPVAFLYQSLRYGHKALSSTCVVTSSQLKTTLRMKMAYGRFYSQYDRNPVIVLGAQVAKIVGLGSKKRALGQQLKINNQYFNIIGVLAETNTNLILPFDLNNSVFLPDAAALRIAQNINYNNLVIRFKPTASINNIEFQLKHWLNSLLGPMRYYFRTPAEWLAQMKKQRTNFAWLLGSIGGIALLVGGIGIMNIMLVSVIERRREIGIRLAVGARSKDIQRMFLYEAVILSVLGGLLGTLLGMLGTWVMAKIAHWDYLFLIKPMMLGLSISFASGIFFGYYPARRASKLVPIAALRSN